MEKFRIITEKDLREITERYFGECELVYSYESDTMAIFVKEPKIIEEDFRKWVKECFGDYLTRDLHWHPLDNEDIEVQANRLGFSEWEPGEYYKIERPIEERDAMFVVDKWYDWANKPHERVIIRLSTDIVEKAIREYRIDLRQRVIDRLWD